MSHSQAPITLMRAEGIQKTFSVRGRPVAAVKDADLLIGEGEVLGLVGESGSGKSTLGKIIAGLLAPDAGHLWYEGQPFDEMDAQRKKKFRREVQVVFQNPLHSLNPRMTVGSTLSEPFLIHKDTSVQGPRKEAARLLEQVGLPARYMSRFPVELSGGERQRVSIARAIALKPKLIILDEAVSSLDVLVRAGILNLLLDLHLRHRLSYLFISHDLRVVRHICDRICVMSAGRIVESGPTEITLKNPQDAYTQSLIQSSGL
ncbi:MAG: ABC transporter ATP-binding protein [Candidatus Omnitrophica bacterium]|nr:ABC transporter ATP-binding protein [Candidatus Omnitrophota bacterium]